MKRLLCWFRGHLRGEMRWAEDRKGRVNYLRIGSAPILRRVEFYCSRCGRWCE